MGKEQEKNKKFKKRVILALPVAVIGARRSEIPRHDFMGYMKMDEILAAIGESRVFLASDITC